MMLSGKKNILCFGAGSFLAKEFIRKFGQIYNLISVSRKGLSELNFDFEKPECISAFRDKIDFKIDGIIFFQGINPSVGFQDMSYEHFCKMFKVNIIVPSLMIKELSDKFNDDCSIVFFSSVAKKKGSYDPAYGSSKAALTGLIHSLANSCNHCRFNILSLGLVEGSPVHKNMTDDFVKKHADRMFQKRLIRSGDVIGMVDELIRNNGLNRVDIEIDGGYS